MSWSTEEVKSGAAYVRKMRWEWEFLEFALSQGFQPIELPILERYRWDQLVAEGREDLSVRKKWLNEQGEVESLRYDWTEVVARQRIQDNGLADRVAYVGDTFWNDGMSRQLGLEAFQTPFPLAEQQTLEVILPYLQEKIQQAPMTAVIGYHHFYQFYLPASPLIEETQLREAIRYKNNEAIQRLINNSKRPEEYQSLLSLLMYLPKRESTAFPKPPISTPAWQQAVQEIRVFASLLRECGVQEIVLDVGATPKRSYYEGITCQIYVTEALEPITTGGRYRLPSSQEASSFGMAINMPVLELFGRKEQR
ncbi:ATP phosphoribosyltransferase regulatory subunit [Risungbinella massiliensis]|uniref:ATP phosphoribosyltransferase regulatory subunit n=1 Tax=Risungbinella massiliensis TaxID=1329796 RepID=UPI0005CC04D3|nr:ATP phosphoribosyltransferase regulatory subunit [Risungbinella massiliensis]